MLKAYLDESGRANEHPVVVVGGFLGTVPLWERFEGRWRAFLDEFGVARFHASEFHARRGQFSRWNEAQRLKAEGAIGDILVDLKPFAVGLAVEMKAFREWRSEQATYYPEDPYCFCLDHCFRYLIQGISEHPKDAGIEIFVDRDKKREPLGRELAQWHQDQLRKAPWFYRIAPDRPLSINYGSSFDHLPLQAADVIAHSSFRWGCAYVAGETKENYLASDHILAAMRKANCPLAIQFYNDKEMIKIMRRGKFYNDGSNAKE